MTLEEKLDIILKQQRTIIKMLAKTKVQSSKSKKVEDYKEKFLNSHANRNN
jgi:hypothetical protein